MVASQNKNLLWIFNFEGKQQANCLDALPSPVDIVPQEQIVGLRRQSAILEEPEHVIVLSMDIPTNLGW